MANRDPLHEHLTSLRDADAPERLWARVDRAHRHRTRRWQWGLGATAALALAAVAVLPLRPLLQPSPAPAPALTAIDVAAPAAAAATPDARLRALDRDLQAAYRRNASEAEIAELWITRRALLASRRGQPVNPVRI